MQNTANYYIDVREPGERIMLTKMLIELLHFSLVPIYLFLNSIL
jgi:hypothetical protein